MARSLLKCFKSLAKEAEETVVTDIHPSQGRQELTSISAISLADNGAESGPSAITHPETFGAVGFDTERRFVRIIKRHDNGLVRFEFSVGTPDFSVELMLPEIAFDEFCIRQKAVFVHEESQQPWEQGHDD